MLFPSQISLYVADNEQPWEYVWIEFDGLQVKSAIEQSGLSENNPVYHPSSIETRNNLLNEMLYIVKNKDAAPLQLIGHLYLFWIFLAALPLKQLPLKEPNEKAIPEAFISTKQSDI